MANGPGLSWGAGVADARPSELTANALPTTGAGEASQSSCIMHSPEVPSASSAPDAPTALPEPSGGAFAPETKDAADNKAESNMPAAAIGRGSNAHRVRFEESSNDAKPPALEPLSPTRFTTTPQVAGPAAPPDLPAAAIGAGESNDGGDDGGGTAANAGGKSQASGGHPEAGEGEGGNRISSSSSKGGGTGNVGGDGTTGAGGLGNGGIGGSGNVGSRKSSGGLPSIPAPAAGGSGASPQLLSLETSSSMLEHVSREVIRKLRLAASAGSPEDRHVVCEELFADITCALDASAQAALLGPAAPEVGTAPDGGSGGGGVASAAVSGSSGSGAAVGSTEGSSAVLPTGRRGRVRGRLYYEVLAVHYASRAAADSARALLHLCQLLWDAPWVAPIYALLLHRFLLLPREAASTAASPTAAASPSAAAAAAAAATSASTGSGGGGGGPSKPLKGASYSDPRVKHLNVLAHGARQLLLGDVHSGLSRFQPLWSFLALEVAGLGSQRNASGSDARGSGGDGTAVALPPVISIDVVPAAARPWLLAVAAAFLPYYCLDEQVEELARRFPPPMPMEGGGGGGSANSAAAAAASLAGLDFLIVEVTDVLGRINSEAGLLKYLRALRALARPPPPPPPPRPVSSAALAASTPASSPGAQHGQGAAAPPQADGLEAAAGPPPSSRSGTVRDAAAAARAGSDGAGRRDDAGAAARARGSPPQQPHPLDGLPTITKLRLQSELYSLTSGGGPRYAPPEVRRAAFAALDALFPGGRSLRWLVRWASRTLHMEWLEADAGSDDPWAGRGWLDWIYWPIHWCTALYGKILLAIFQLIYGMVVWRPWRRGAAEVASVAGTGGAITVGRRGSGGGAVAGAAGGGGGGEDVAAAAAACDVTHQTAAIGATAATALLPSNPFAGAERDGRSAGATGPSAEGPNAEGPSAEGPSARAVGSRSKAGPWWQPRLRG